ncbi:MAG: hypothetical protein KC476_02810 [Cyanobacteria bacterium HKST-UBA06]|nr:hypothetical protein [Cyanobacteria bacterium HKST-UBA06]
MTISSTLLAKMVSQTPGLVNRTLGTMVMNSEGAGGYALNKFIQDLGIAAVPRLTVSRSKTERAEISFIELAESLVYCYGIGGAGKYIFENLMHGLVPKSVGLNKSVLTKSVEAIEKGAPQLARHAVSTKAGILMASVGLMAVSAQYSLHFLKNLMTHNVFKQNKFSDVVNLSHGKSVADDHNPVVTKAKRRIVQAVSVGGALILAGMGLARFGHKLPTPLFNVIKAGVKHLDFAHGKKAYTLSQPLLRYVFAPINVLGYIDAARDNLERVETATRLAVVVPSLLYGQELLESAMESSVKGSMPHLFNPTGSAKTLKQLATEAVGEAGSLSKAMPTFAKHMAAKNRIFGAPLLFSILIPGVGVALLNRAWTKYRYNRNLPSANPLQRHENETTAQLDKIGQIGDQLKTIAQQEPSANALSKGPVELAPVQAAAAQTPYRYGYQPSGAYSYNQSPNYLTVSRTESSTYSPYSATYARTYTQTFPQTFPYTLPNRFAQQVTQPYPLNSRGNLTV